MPFSLDPAKSATIEEVYRAFLAELDYLPGNVMLDYSLLLHGAWRPLFGMLPLEPGMSVLDVGCGYGLAAAELAAQLALRVTGIDIEPHYVEGADSVLQRVGARGVLDPGSTVEFTEAGIEDIGLADDTFDFVLVREVFQFVADPHRAAAELYRVTKPGGYVCVSDNDDDLYVSFPDPPASFAELHRAIAAVQVDKGGDRRVGRKLSTFLSQAGFSINSVVGLPEARHWTVTEDDVERAFMIGQIEEARTRVVEAGKLTDGEFDGLLEDYRAESLGEHFRFNARIVAVGRKPV